MLEILEVQFGGHMNNVQSDNGVAISSCRLNRATGPAGDFWTFGPLLDSLLVSKYSSFHKNDVAKIRRVSGLQKVPEIKTYEK
jgi:hypothetical protein